MSDKGREVLVDEKQRDAERGALRNVRGALDGIDSEERKIRKLRRIVFVIAALLFVLLVAYFAPIFMKSKEPGNPPAWPQLRQKQ